MKDFWEEPKEKIINRKKIIITVVVAILLILLITITIIYKNNKSTRNWIDKNIFRKEIHQNNLANIEIDEINSSNIYAFGKYFGILNKNKFDIYNDAGKKEASLDIEVTNPLFGYNNRYLVIAEKSGQKLYLIEDKKIILEEDVEGSIEQVTINKNGYIAVTIVDTSYKTVIAMYNNKGELLFNQYLPSTRVASTSISNDNKYLALAEVDTTGTMVQSNIRIISIENGINRTEDSVKKVYNSENNDLITNIKYQDRNKLLCMYTDKIVCIKEDESIDTIQEYKDRKITFASIDLSNTSVTIEEKSSGLFTADSVINIINTSNKSKTLYTAETVTKEIYTADDVIALNLGSEVEFISTNGWLLKRYTAEQEVNSIVLSDSIACIVYRDKIEIINL